MSFPAPPGAIVPTPTSSGSRPWMMNLYVTATDIAVVNFIFLRNIRIKQNGAGPTWDLILDYDGTNKEIINYANQATAQAVLTKLTTHLDQTLNTLQDYSTLP